MTVYDTLNAIKTQLDMLLSRAGSTRLPANVYMLDLPGEAELKEFCRLYDAEKRVKFMSASEGCAHDALPERGTLLVKIRALVSGNEAPDNDTSQMVVLTRLDRAWLMNHGNKCFQQELTEWLDPNNSGNAALPARLVVVIVTLGCARHATLRDRRFNDRGQLLQLNGAPDPLPTLSLAPNDDEATNLPHGLELLFQERLDEGKHNLEPLRCVASRHTCAEFAEALIPLRPALDFFQRLCECVPGFDSAVQHDYGTPEQWQQLYSDVTANGSWDAFVKAKFGNATDAKSLFLSHWHTAMTNEQRWQLFIALRLATRPAGALSLALAHAISPDELERRIVTGCGRQHDDYQQICNALTIEQRNRHVTVLTNNLDLDDPTALRQLSDRTDQERLAIVTLLNRHHYDLPRLQRELPAVAKNLAYYIGVGSAPGGEEVLRDYFEEYRLCKLRNTISHRLRELLPLAAMATNKLPLRGQYIAIMAGDSTPMPLVYFVDALGAEFVPFVLAECHERGLFCEVEFAKAKLPTITSVNKPELLELLGQRGLEVPENHQVPDLDQVKHKGKDVDYASTKFPVYLFKELHLLEGLLSRIANELEPGGVCYVVSDHGATRMPTLAQEPEVTKLPGSGGKHCGRCAPKAAGDGVWSPEEGIVSSDIGDGPEWWCLTTWGKIKGGRPSAVEAHGGATPEELVVPIFTITKPAKQLVVKVSPEVLEVKNLRRPHATVDVTVKGYKGTFQLRHADKLYAPDNDNPGSFDLSEAVKTLPALPATLPLTLIDQNGKPLATFDLKVLKKVADNDMGI